VSKQSDAAFADPAVQAILVFGVGTIAERQETFPTLALANAAFQAVGNGQPVIEPAHHCNRETGEQACLFVKDPRRPEAWQHPCFDASGRAYLGAFIPPMSARSLAGFGYMRHGKEKEAVPAGTICGWYLNANSCHDPVRIGVPLPLGLVFSANFTTRYRDTATQDFDFGRRNSCH